MRAGCRVVWLVFACVAALAPGCKRSDLVENELRARDNQFREAVEELNRTGSENEALRREVAALRTGTAPPSEIASNVYGLRRIVLGRATTGVDNDNAPGDEALQVWLEPRDGDDHTIKVPGTLEVCVLEITTQGQKVPLSCWEIGPAKLADAWKQGLLTVGFQVILPWKVPPRTENIRVAARLTLPDGRAFEADRDIRIRLLPEATLRPEMGAPVQVPLFKPAYPVGPAGGANAKGAPVQPVNHWQPPPLEDSVTLGKPLPTIPRPKYGVPTSVLATLDGIRLDD
jgi:hypothetical protein